MSEDTGAELPVKLTLGLRLEKIHRNEVEIVVMDLEDCPRDQEILLQKEMKQLLENAPDQSVLLLNNLTNAPYDPQLVNSWKLLANLFEKKVRKSAIYGASPFTKVSIAGYFQAGVVLFGIRRNNRGQIFNSRMEALEWLVK